MSILKTFGLFRLNKKIATNFAVFLIGTNHSRLVHSLLSKRTNISPFLLARVGQKILSKFIENDSINSKTRKIFIRHDKEPGPKNLLLDIFSFSSQKKDIRNMSDLLKSNQEAQVNWLLVNAQSFLTNSAISIFGTHVTRAGVLMTSLILKKNLVYLISFERVIDWIYFPKLGLVLSATLHGRKGPVGDLVSLLQDNFSVFEQQWTNLKPKKTRQVIQSTRIMHHVDQELVAANYFRETLGIDDCLIRDRASFFEFEIYRKLGLFDETKHSFDTIEDLIEAAETSLLFHAWFRSPKRNQNEPFWSSLQKTCLVANHADSLPPGRLGFWLGITSGEKRSFLDEVDTLIATVNFLRDKYGPKCFFVFDGFTSTHCLGANEEVVTKQRRMLSEITEVSAMKEQDYFSLIGATGEKKVTVASSCLAFVSSGSPVVWPSKLAGIPGVIYGNRQSLYYWSQNSTGQGERTIFPDIDKIEDGESQGLRKEWHWQDFSIPPEHIVECLESCLELYVNIES